MGHVLHGCATTTEAIRRAIQHSEASLRALAKRYGVNQKTVANWKRRTSTADIPTGPKDARSTVLSIEEEAIAVAFRRHTLCHWTTASTLCRLRSRISRDHRCTAVCSGKGSVACRTSMATSPRSGSSRRIRSAISTSTWPRFGPSRASYTCLSRSIEPRGLPSSNCTRKPLRRSQPTFSAAFWQPCPTRCTRF